MKTIALCLEYPLALRAGVSVLVETMLPAFKEHYRLVLVSPDTPESLAKSPVAGLVAKHFTWVPGAVSRVTSRQLAQQLAGEGVALAHFHFGGNYGWGSRFPGRCPVTHADNLGIRVCSTVHSVTGILDGYCGPQKPLWFKLALLPAAWLAKIRVLRHVRAEIAVSQNNVAKLRRWYPPVSGKFVQIYHSRLREGSRPQPSINREPFILNAGHIAWRKGQLVLCEAFAQIAARHPDWKLWLVGDPTEPEIVNRIRQVSAAHGLEDRILLPGERNDLKDLMARAGIYVQPSYEEALGLALQEAMFAGCPCIGTRVGGIPELIDDGKNGVLVAPGQVAELAQALETLMSDASSREHYGRAAAEAIVAKGMTVEQMTARHLELYETILRDH